MKDRLVNSLKENYDLSQEDIDFISISLEGVEIEEDEEIFIKIYASTDKSIIYQVYLSYDMYNVNKHVCYI